ncbi:penicillin-binding protein 1A [Balnearium lithotrophicum]|uniref:Penicillin-binding protein 1A n=1 Tax=Balnearium lithotrophicum TaxID=223788 RepID=A0A521AQT2_9BACT|nr:PBP1A family penicillin-binding protein [Balnearium lithotrophicum]SMO37121.1 penicillin-binding protein 1A [Balnearium lithotrophicum]
MLRLFLLTLVAVITLFQPSLASKSYEMKLMPPFASEVYGNNGKIIGFYYQKHFRLYTPYDKVPLNLVYAVVTAEDDRFFSHKGIDPIGILRAAITDVSRGKVVQGGSTITQQLAKMIFLSPQRTIERKLKEIELARKLEKKLTKEEILELYLNYVYLSNGAYGVRAAAWVLFGEDLYQLTTAQCALLAGIIRGPEYYNPFKHPERALKRRNFILKKMLEKNYITKDEYEKAIKEPLTPLKSPNLPRTAGYDLDFVKYEILKKGILTKRELYTGGYKIFTSLDPEIENYAQEILKNYRDFYANKHKVDDLQCAGFAVDRDGRVIFIVGGSNYSETKLNRAFQVQRPIGSTAKPFTYLTAFQNGWSPLDFISNQPIEKPTDKFDPKTGERVWWRPQNYEGTFSPFMTLREALMNSVNVATLHLAMEFPQKVRKNLIKFELIDKNSPFNLSYVLGSFPSNLYRVVRAFSGLQNDGILKEPYVVEKVENKFGRVVYRGFPKLKRASDTASVVILRSILEDVVKRGTAKTISYLTKDFDVAGKTGTTNDFKDAYFTGFTTSFVMSIWFGRDSYQTMWRGAAGGVVSAPPWGKIAEKICEKYGCGRFEPPYEEIVKNYPPPSHFPEKEMEEIYYDNLINQLEEEELVGEDNSSSDRR